ncbi:UvrD-helicase domain-containing protein [Shewanella benthica]|nr:UvrD-helicase domain-containing protein [Shewanella benthica]
MMDSRPYLSSSFDDLNQKSHSCDSDIIVLQKILHELTFRKKNKRSPDLSSAIRDRIQSLSSYSSVADESGSKAQSYDSIISEVCINQAENIPKYWDPEQRVIIELNADESKIVEAGPGTGKTAVACARVAYLIEKCGLEASKIFLISFTRTAVKELRDRIEAFAQDSINVAGLQIFTLDSFTWQVLRGLGDDTADLMSSYEMNINKLIEQLKHGDYHLLDYLEEFEHVVLDEGQDLVGERADLILQIISRLEEECGVTIFADSAQAIYGFTDDSDLSDSYKSLTVVERIMEGELDGIDRIKLTNVHRTNDPQLIKLFKGGRERLLDKKESDVDGWLSMKQLIKECSHGDVERINKQNLRGKRDHLVLFRTRAEVLINSSYLWSDDVVHKLRMSGISQRIHPWIGRLLGQYEGDFLTKDEFNGLWATRIGKDNNSFFPHREDSWNLLLNNVGDKNDRVRIVRLREILTRERPPIDFLVDESQLAGPVLGTIHASKGREANQVHLMLPPDDFIEGNMLSPYAQSPRKIAEEERVLFVGATRAKQKLMVGKGQKTYASRLDSGRSYKKPTNGKHRRMVEVGLVGDIDSQSIVDGRLGIDINYIQDWFWHHAAKKVEAEAIFDYKLQARVLFAKDDGIPVALLSNSFNQDIWKLAKTVAKKEGFKKLKPSKIINNIKIVGVTTIVIPEVHRSSLPAPWCHSGFLIVPVITGFPMVYFNQWNEK